MVSIDTNSAVKTKLSLSEGEETDNNNPLSKVFASILSAINEPEKDSDKKSDTMSMSHKTDTLALDVDSEVNLHKEEPDKINTLNVYIVSSSDHEIMEDEGAVLPKALLDNNDEEVLNTAEVNTKEKIKNSNSPSIVSNSPSIVIEENVIKNSEKINFNKVKNNNKPENKPISNTVNNIIPEEKLSQKEKGSSNESGKLVSTVKKAINLLKNSSAFKSSESKSDPLIEDLKKLDSIKNSKHGILNEVVQKIHNKEDSINKNYFNEDFKNNVIVNRFVNDNYDKKNYIRKSKLDNFDYISINAVKSKSIETESSNKNISNTNNGNITNINPPISSNPSISNFFSSESLIKNTEVLDFAKENWNEKLVNSIKEAIRKGSNRIDFSIEPKRLGKLSITLVIDGGSADIIINASNSSVAQMLGESQIQLQKMLAESGMYLGNFQAKGNGSFSNGSNGKEERSDKNSNQRVDLVEESNKDIDNDNNNQILNLNA